MNLQGLKSENESCWDSGRSFSSKTRKVALAISLTRMEVNSWAWVAGVFRGARSHTAILGGSWAAEIGRAKTKGMAKWVKKVIVFISSPLKFERRPLA